jgi:hypothetical protein
MAKAGWCSDCNANVWVGPEGGCCNGHPRSSMRGLYDAPTAIGQSGGLSAAAHPPAVSQPAADPSSAHLPEAGKGRGCLKALGIGALVLVLFVLTLLVSCRRGPATTPRVLSTGKSIEVISVGKMSFPESGPALILRYQTDLNLDDKQALAQEVDAIWPDFQKEVQSAEVTGAAITASERPRGWPLYHMRQFTFVYTQQPDGTWKQAHSK